MSAIASPEFVSLCQTQLRLLTQKMAESSAALYMADVAEQVRGQSNFVPVVSYPESVDSWAANFAKTAPTPWQSGYGPVPLALPGSAEPAAIRPGAAGLETEIHAERGAEHRAERGAEQDPTASQEREPLRPNWSEILRPEQQMVVPLVYTEVVVGLLVTIRRDRAWQSEERSHIEAVAESLAAGCVLERRNQWLQSQLAHKRSLQSRQSEIFHNLLHQFRNPLTAVTTFGQLLVRRLGSEDANQPVATGIVRESKRLRELVTHFDEAVAVSDADLATDLARESTTPRLPAAQSLLPPPKLLTGETPAERTTDVGQTAALAGNLPLAASSLETGSLGEGLGHPLTLSVQYLPDIVEPVLAVATIVAGEKNIGLQAQVATDTPPVWGDEQALGEVVSNLVDNAIKYSPAGARVWVQTGVSRMAGSSHYQGIVVGDTGPGIPAGDRAQLFQRHYRGVQAAGEIPGTGLGLAIAQSLVGEMRGAIEVITPAVGTPWLPKSGPSDEISASGPGTVFIVWLLEVDRARSLAR
jgi:signal transduction histidine kinase